MQISAVMHVVTDDIKYLMKTYDILVLVLHSNVTYF